MTPDEANTLIDSIVDSAPTGQVSDGGVDDSGSKRVASRRDRLIFELLYGSGLRVGELVGLNLDDFDRNERWIRVRGKGRKERLVPFGGRASEALDAYLQVRGDGKQQALILNQRGGRLTARPQRRTHCEAVRPYCSPATPRFIRTRCGMLLRRTCSATARTCAPSKSCSATPAFRRRRSTRSFR